MPRKSRQHNAVEQSIRTIKRAIFIAPEGAQVLSPHPTQTQTEEAAAIILTNLIEELIQKECAMTLLALVTVSEKPKTRLEISRAFKNGARVRLTFENIKTLKRKDGSENSLPCPTRTQTKEPT